MPLNAANTSPKERAHLADFILKKMSANYQTKSKTGIMLAGDPGIGKTSFIKQFSQLLGLELILIEVPHIVDEHIINVPFVIFDQKGKEKSKGSAKAERKLGDDGSLDKDAYNVVLAKSNLAGQIASATQTPEKELLHNIYGSGDHNLIALHETLGGTKDKLPDAVVHARQTFKCILFIDEYYRTTTEQIRNILRGILNGRIGLDKLDAHAYVIYASNLRDDGVDKLPSNQEFLLKRMTAPKKDEWFGYMINKFKDANKGVKLDMRVMEKFHQILEDSDISSNDLDSDIRSSPRRWEQILLYINAALPCETEGHAAQLLANAEASFTHYQSGNLSNLWPKVEKALRELIQETSGITPGKKTEAHEWRSVLEHQIKVKMKLGNNRSYIPVISGAPGVGKTFEASQLCEALNLRYIYIDCSTLSPDDVNGIPIPDNTKDAEGNDHLTTAFAKPKLFIDIFNQIEEADRAYKSRPDADPNYDKARWKYLIFFDELNRTKTKTFNGIRKLLLDKEFNKELKLPDESIIIAAINPSDLNTTPLTSHMRDILDIIPSDPNWEGMVKFWQADAEHSKIPDLQKAVIRLLDGFTERFSLAATKKNGMSPKKQRFFLVAGDEDDPVYVSPRQYTSLYASLVTSIADLVKKKRIDAVSLSDPDFAQEAMEECDRVVFEEFDSVLSYVFEQKELDADDFMGVVQSWIGENNLIKEAMSTNTAKAGFEGIAERYFHNPDASMSEDAALGHYFESADTTEYHEDLFAFLRRKFQNVEDLKNHIVTMSAKKKERVGLEVKHTEQEVSLLENFVLDLVHSLRVNQINNQFVEITLQTFIAFFKHLGEEFEAMLAEIEDMDEYMAITGPILEINTSITEFLKKEMAALKKG